MTHTGTASALAHAADETREVQDACNTSGVVLSFGRHMQTIYEAARVLNKGTDWRNEHPICYLFAYKVLALAHTEPLDQFRQYAWAETECERIALAVANDPDTVPDYRAYSEVAA